MKRTVFWLIVAALLVLGLMVYRSRSRSDLNVAPDAAEEIEKAKRR
jgi:hypothetical protein